MDITKLLGRAKESELPSIIKNPFGKDKIETINLEFRNYDFRPAYWRGSVGFSNGNTKGRQELEECETFEQLLAQLKALGETLK